MAMLAQIRSAFALSNSTYGSPRMTRENGWRKWHKRRFKRTTDSVHAWPIAPNIIDQDFTVTALNQTWGVDISDVWTREG